MTRTLSICFLLLAAILATALADDIYHGYHPRDVATRSSETDRAFTEEDLLNLIAAMGSGKYTPPEEMNPDFWNQQAQTDLAARLSKLDNENIAKNVIFFLGDGMSIPTLTAARIHKGQRLGKTGEESLLNVEDFPYSGLSKTYCTNGQTPDSSCTATAYMCGVKTNMMMTGVNAHVNFNNCSASADVANHVESIMLWAQLAGKSTGVVTTTTVTHASPSASYAHVANRMWESDADMAMFLVKPERDGGCVDIAQQLIRHEPGRSLDVVLGGGMGKFLPKTTVDAFGAAGSRLDGANLIDEWKAANPKGKFVTTREELLNVNYKKTKKLFGTFNTGDLEFNKDSATKRPTQPRLLEMTKAAIKILKKNPNGYFLFVEGGRIDHGHHNTQAGYALDEMLELDEAIGLAASITKEKDTLIVLTADHAHTMSIAGYPGRGSPILGVNLYDKDKNGMPYNTLNYAVGPQQYYDDEGKRLNLTGIVEELSITPSFIPADMGTHAGDDVAILARGPQSRLFSGIMQQNMIPHLMAYAMCIGKGATLCDPKPTSGAVVKPVDPELETEQELEPEAVPAPEELPELELTVPEPEPEVPEPEAEAEVSEPEAEI